MTHPLVLQLRFTRSELQRAVKGLTEAEAQKRFLPMNCISWNVGHLAWQEQKRYSHDIGQGQILFPDIRHRFAYGAPASTPELKEVWTKWKKITAASDPLLDALTVEQMQQSLVRNGKPAPYLIGSLLLRMIYHYWYHIGECLAIRQMLGHERLPVFVGDLDGKAPYQAE